MADVKTWVSANPTTDPTWRMFAALSEPVKSQVGARSQAILMGLVARESPHIDTEYAAAFRQVIEEAYAGTVALRANEQPVTSTREAVPPSPDLADALRAGRPSVSAETVLLQREVPISDRPIAQRPSDPAPPAPDLMAAIRESRQGAK